MAQKVNDVMEIRKYLLGELSDQEQSRIEERFLTEPDCFQEFLKTEESLTDEYVMGELSEQERQRFESYFMKAPERRQSVEFASVLSRHTSQAREQARLHKRLYPIPASRWGSNRSLIAALACAILLLAACTTWLAIQTARLRKEVEQARIEKSMMNGFEEQLKRLNEQQTTGEELSRQLDELQAKLVERDRELKKLSQARDLGAHTPEKVVSAVLVAGLGRSEGQSQQINVSSGTSRLRLSLMLEGQTYKSYSAELKSAEGQRIFIKDHLRERKTKDGKAVVVDLPAKRITESDYLVVLSGATEGEFEKLRTYQFRAVRR